MGVAITVVKSAFNVYRKQTLPQVVSWHCPEEEVKKKVRERVSDRETGEHNKRQSKRACTLLEAFDSNQRNTSGF